VGLWHATKAWWRRHWRSIKKRCQDWWRRALTWFKRLAVKLKLTRHQSVRVEAAPVEVEAAVSAAGIVVEPRLEKRVEHLEAWRTDQEDDQRIAAGWLAAGFILIAVGTLLDLIIC
jgi:hypothetical protein